MNFVDVTDIVIPQGEVIKIHETVTGRVLWEKITAIEINPKWYKIKATAFLLLIKLLMMGVMAGISNV